MYWPPFKPLANMCAQGLFLFMTCGMVWPGSGPSTPVGAFQSHSNCGRENPSSRIRPIGRLSAPLLSTFYPIEDIGKAYRVGNGGNAFDALLLSFGIKPPSRVRRFLFYPS